MRMLVIGDACVDEYIYCQRLRQNPESSAPLVSEQRPPSRTRSPGMAANVARNLRAFGVNVVEELGPRELCVKRRYIDSATGEHLLRVDTESPVPSARAWREAYDLAGFDAVVVSDYGKGFLSRDDILRLSSLPNCFIDTKVRDLAGAGEAWFKLNAKETEQLTSAPPRLVTTLGAKGSMCGGIYVPARPVEVWDVCGAGDTYLAAFAYAITLGRGLSEAMLFATKCAAVTCRHTGTYALQPDDIPQL